MNRDSDLNESDFQVSERRVNSTCKGSEKKWTKPHSKKTMCQAEAAGGNVLEAP